MILNKNKRGKVKFTFKKIQWWLKFKWRSTGIRVEAIDGALKFLKFQFL